MPLTPEQVKELKYQLMQQIEHLPEDRKAEAINQINSLSEEDLEELLRQQQSKPQGKQQSPFRMIVSGELESNKIGENNLAIAVLDINPISKGHTLIIPKQPSKDSQSIPSSIFTFAKNLAKKISIKLKATNTAIQTEQKFGEAIIHIIPEYNVPLSLDSKRTKASNEELYEIAKKFTIKPKLEKIKMNKQIKPSNIPLFRTKRRIA